jgi:chitin synthase
MKGFKKGPYVFDNKAIQAGLDLETPKVWAVYDSGLYDLSDYFYTIAQNAGNKDYQYLPKDISDLIQQQPGSDVTDAINNLRIDPNTKNAALACMRNVFYIGETDFRESARCQFPGYILLAFSAILVATIAAK